MLKQLASPYTSAASSTTLSMQQAADTLYQQLLQPKSQPSKAGIVQLLCATGNPGPNLRAFDPALVAGFKKTFTAQLSMDLTGSGGTVWFAAALAQLQLREQARDSPVLAEVLAGAGLLDEVYLRCGEKD
jgi:hypothetical protein